MAGKRKRYSAEFKAKVALEAIRGVKTSNELASEYGIHPVQIAQWKKQAVEGLAEMFGTRRVRAEKEAEGLTTRLYEEIGRLKVELDWMKKKVGVVG